MDLQNLGARWNITVTAEGKHLVYENLVRHLVFDCGVCHQGTPMSLIMDYILFEGDPGDLVFINGEFAFQTHRELCV